MTNPDIKTLNTQKKHIPKPNWLKTQVTKVDAYYTIKDKLNNCKLNTICESGKCPNKAECWELGTATLMILGDVCTRSCRFCAVNHGIIKDLDQDEPKKVAEMVNQLKLKHVVLTSVTRDDLEDGGAEIWAKTIKEIHNSCKDVTIEALIPDFNGDKQLLDLIIEAKPEIVAHNIETVKRLTPIIRIIADYYKSLDVLNYLSSKGIKTKSGIMVGLGESDEEVFETISDIYHSSCKILTIGQYLQPSRNQISVERYVDPSIFEQYKSVALNIGFLHVDSAPLVRSSYHSALHIK